MSIKTRNKHIFLFISGAWRGPSGCARAAGGRSSAAPLQAQHRRVHRADQGGVQLPSGAVPQVSSSVLPPPPPSFILITDSTLEGKLCNSGIRRSFVPIRERRGRGEERRGVRFCRSALLCVILGMAIRVSSSLPDSFMHWLPAGEQVNGRWPWGATTTPHSADFQSGEVRLRVMNLCRLPVGLLIEFS